MSALVLAGIVLLVAYGTWGTAGLVLAALALITAWCVWVYACPFTAHRRCNGSGRNVSRKRKYFGQCRSSRCNNGTIQRLGSRTITRAVRGTADAARKRKK